MSVYLYRLKREGKNMYIYIFAISLTLYILPVFGILQWWVWKMFLLKKIIKKYNMKSHIKVLHIHIHKMLNLLIII